MSFALLFPLLLNGFCICFIIEVNIVFFPYKNGEL